MFLKIHRARGMGDVVAVCDRELLNRTLCQGSLTITISEKFYGNTPATEDEVRNALANAGNINLVGERSVGIAIGMGILEKTGCMIIGTVPHAQIYRL